MAINNLIPTLQLSIGPVILISGIGLILLSMTNRLGRVIDRSRILSERFRTLSGLERERDMGELRILATRARLIRAAITFAVFSVLLTSILVISLFLGALLKLEIAAVLVTIFVLCMLSLIVSLILFLSDVNLTLKALWLEIPPELRP